MTAIVLALALAAHPACYADGHNAKRSRSALRAFRHAQPCPAGADRGSVVRCQGFVIDHVCALECCGRDEPVNMQWQSRADGKAKDRWEANCSTCTATNRKE